MAAPSEVTLANLSGKWVLNRKLADDPDPMLAFQGVPWLLRKIILLATVTIAIKEYVDDGGVTHIDLDQTATGGIDGTREERALDWSESSHEDHIFGTLTTRCRWVGDLEKAESGNGGPLHEFLREGWVAEKVGPNGEGWVQSWAWNEERGWSAEQIWGFSVFNEERYMTRRVLVKKAEEVLTVTLAYNWKGEGKA